MEGNEELIGSPLGDSDFIAKKSETRPAHQRLVLTDPVAFRYLEEDPSITVLERRRRLQGYELYIVEQWICSRVHPTFVITTYTGLEQHSVLVGVLSVPTDEDQWSPRLRVWFKALAKYHARRKETPLGILMVTNLSGFPSALTVVPVPDGDVKGHREDFIVNENMKRMGCSGRAGLNLIPPTGATQAKFLQLYRTSDRVQFYGAVIELVKLCQVALVLYGKLAPEYADGLICDITEQAINDWWNDLGTEYFNVDPTDGILGPTTVAALLGILMGARNRLHAYGAPVAKDVFDTASTKRGIAYFQKTQKDLQRTRRLDLKTLQRLRNVTAKAASGEGWTVPRAVKTTVAELSGKGGDMVMGRIGAREKAGIADIETLDIETFISLISGERSKWLWYGKPRKHNDTQSSGNIGAEDGMMFTKDEKGGYVWSSQKRESVVDDSRMQALSNRIYSHQSHESQISLDSPEREPTLRRNVLKGVQGKMTDARNGLGRIKDAVGMTGFRGHHHKYSKEDPLISDGDSFKERPTRKSGEKSRKIEKGELLPRHNDLSKEDDDSKEGSLRSVETGNLPPDTTDLARPSAISQDICRDEAFIEQDGASIASVESADISLRIEEPSPAPPMRTADNILASELDPPSTEKLDIYSSGEIDGNHHAKQFQREHAFPPTLRRRQSLPEIRIRDEPKFRTGRWPRRLSFNIFPDAEPAGIESDWASSVELNASKDHRKALVRERDLAFQAQLMAAELQRIKDVDSSVVEAKVNEVISLDAHAGRDHDILGSTYSERLEEYNNLRDATEDLLTEEKINLTDAVKDIETLGAKLEYELDALQSKVEDMENGIAEYERQVVQLETRAEEFDGEKEESWLRWYLNLLTGKGFA
ncbi:protein STB6 [Physcia stellaris]|nr:protein STB6 [Physcia stellaris]